ncbi:MAG: hypothetical protein JW754_05045 [Candidatus Aenigmarchaeota archaeon]|nr:hypothetical protein [Candidatus Aenigmarchaeota archaeon]
MSAKEILRDYFWGVGIAFFVAGLLIMLPSFPGSEYILIILGAILMAVGVIHRPK